MPELVQPILVADDLTHLEAIVAAVRASVSARETSPAAPWERWLSGRFTKTVRRVKRSRIPALLDLPGASVDLPDRPSAMAFAPVTYEDFPKPVARAQVSGTDFRRDESRAGGDAFAPTTIFVLDTLTTGKAAAQAAHAAWLAGVTGARVLVRLTTDETLAALVEDARTVAVVRDAGLTEVAANTLTAVALRAERTGEPVCHA